MAKLVVLEVWEQQKLAGFVSQKLSVVPSRTDAHKIAEGDLAEGLATQFFAHLRESGKDPTGLSLAHVAT